MGTQLLYSPASFIDEAEYIEAGVMADHLALYALLVGATPTLCYQLLASLSSTLPRYDFI